MKCKKKRAVEDEGELQIKERADFSGSDGPNGNGGINLTGTEFNNGVIDLDGR